MSALEQARISLWRAAECRSSMNRADYLYRARDALQRAELFHWADLAESAALRIGGDGADMRELLFDVEAEISRREHALPEAAQ